MRSRLSTLLYCGILSALLLSAPQLGHTAAPGDADLILHNGKIVTGDANFSIAQAVAIRDGKFIAVGANQSALQLSGPNTERIDLQGKTVLPGLTDAHAHMDREGLKYVYPSLAGAYTKRAVLDIIRAEVEKASPGDWIVTMPLGDPPYFAKARDILERTGLNRYDLDTVAPANPVYIRSIWGFWDQPPLVAIANSEALRLAGITSATQPPYPGIVIDKDESGEPTGVFRELNSQPALEHSLFEVVPRFTHQIRVDALRKSMQIYNSLGTTSTYEGHGIASEIVQAYKELWEKGELTVRSALVISPTPGWYKSSGPQDRPEFDDMYRDWATYAAGKGFGDGFLRTTGVFFQPNGDPALAAILAEDAPYTAWAAYYYDGATDSALATELFRYAAMLAAKYGLRMNVISGGGAGLEQTLNVYEEVNQTYDIRDKRWVIEHIGANVTPTHIQRMKQLGVVLTTNSTGFWDSNPPSSFENYRPYKSLLQAGLKLCLATDNVPPNPFFALWGAISRANQSAGTLGPLSEKLTRREALRAMTINSAYLTFEEDVKGSIEVGKYADLIVLDRDYLEVPQGQIKDIKVLTTIVDGKTVYSR